MQSNVVTNFNNRFVKFLTERYLFSSTGKQKIEAFCNFSPSFLTKCLMRFNYCDILSMDTAHVSLIFLSQVLSPSLPLWETCLLFYHATITLPTMHTYPHEFLRAPPPTLSPTESAVFPMLYSLLINCSCIIYL